MGFCKTQEVLTVVCGTVRTGKSATQAVAVQTENRNYWCGADRGDKFSVRTISTGRFITVRISGNALKQGGGTSDSSLVEHTQYYVRAGHNCKNIRLRIKTMG